MRSDETRDEGGGVIETPEVTEIASESPRAPSSLDRFAVMLATAGGAGFAPLAPGTFGSAVGVLLFVGLSLSSPLLFLVVTLGLLFIGIAVSTRAEVVFGKKDDGRIVIDEVVGQLLTLAPLLILAPDEKVRSAAPLVTGFVAFRWLDIWKPGPVRWAERNFRGGAGVMMDDVVAGLLGGVLMAVAIGFAVAGGVW